MVRLQKLTTAVEQKASKVGLRMNSDKCKVMVSGDWEGRSDINASGVTIETAKDNCYMWSYISSKGDSDKEVWVRVGKTAAVFLRASAMLKHVIDIGWTSVRPSVRPRVCLSVRHTLVLYQNG